MMGSSCSWLWRLFQNGQRAPALLSFTIPEDLFFHALNFGLSFLHICREVSRGKCLCGESEVSQASTTTTIPFYHFSGVCWVAGDLFILVT